ncbi:MAG: copper chaperone PCu(A)C [Sphingomonadaceae bacterium]|nr:copper chaperone PCu(A)C [Sphingomonadaceae bacterium]
MTGDRRMGMAACAGAVALLLGALAAGAAHSQTTTPADPKAETAGVRATDAVVRAPLAPGRPAVGYVTLHGGARPETLTSASSDAAERIELHRSSARGGVMSMQKVRDVVVPANGELKLAPGGYHLMIFGLKPNLKTADIQLKFASNRTLTVHAQVEGAAAGPGHAQH